MASLAEFERDLIRERVKSGIAAAKASGKKMGRQAGDNIKADKFSDKVMKLVAEGKSQRDIATQLNLSKTTVNKIVKANRCEQEQSVA